MSNLLQNVAKILRDEGGVVRIGQLFEHFRSEFGFEKSQDTFRRHLLREVEETGSADSTVSFEPDGYWALSDIDFWEWSAKNRSAPGFSDSTKRRVWARAAGQCQFPGCPEDLTQDSQTQAVGNFGQIAHIVATSVDGPRGDAQLSHKLADDFSNLLLLCYRHHRLVDTDTDKYTKDVLRGYKREHEDRIARILALDEAQETHVLTIRGRIGNQPVEIPISEIVPALYPRYPASRHLDVDLTALVTHESSDSYWEQAAETLVYRMRQVLDPRPNETINHLSICALAPIPLLVLAGRILGDKVPVTLFQHDRAASENPWSWKAEAAADDIEVSEAFNANPKNTPVLALSLSHVVDRASISRAVAGDHDLYEIRVAEPSVMWLKTQEQLSAFRKAYVKMQEKIETVYGKTRTVHIFGAIPAPIAVEVGRLIHPKVAPELVLYDFVDGEHRRVLVIQRDVSIAAP